MTDLLDGNYQWGNLAPVEQSAYTTLLDAAEIVPAPQTVPVLAAIALGVGSFAAGWEIGSALDHEWLHIHGDGLGTTQGIGGTLTGVKWIYRASGLPIVARSGALIGRTPAGWYAAMHDSGSNVDAYTLKDIAAGATIKTAVNTAGYTRSSFEQSAWPYVQGQPWAGRSYDLGPCCFYAGNWDPDSPHSLAWGIPVAEMPGLLPADQPLQPYNGQPKGISSGWASPSTGAGITTTAPGFGGGGTNPNPQQGSFWSAIDPRSDPTRNDLNCRIDPLHYHCPPTSPDGTAWAGNGGAAIAWPEAQPTETYTTYVNRLRTLGWLGTATVYELDATAGDSEFAASGVPCTSVAPGDSVFPDDGVTFYTNPAALSSTSYGGGSFSCAGDLATTRYGNRCTFHNVRWSDQIAGNETFYNQACDDAWAYFWANQQVIGADGLLVPNAFENNLISHIYQGDELKDARVQRAMAAADPDLAHWWKASTKSFPSTYPFQVHFYYNDVTREALFGVDWKIRFDRIFGP